MPAISPSALIGAIMDGFQRSGGAAFFLSERLQTHPRRFAVEYLTKSLSVWMYIWTLTPGGRDTLPDEFRIQMTAVESPLALSPTGYTVLTEIGVRVVDCTPTLRQRNQGQVAISAVWGRSRAAANGSR